PFHGPTIGTTPWQFKKQNKAKREAPSAKRPSSREAPTSNLIPRSGIPLKLGVWNLGFLWSLDARYLELLPLLLPDFPICVSVPSLWKTQFRLPHPHLRRM